MHSLLQKKHIPTDSPSCIRTFNVNKQAKIRLFCFHYAGGNISTFSHWHKSLSDEIEICGVLLPGRLDLSHHEPIKNMQELIPYLCSQLLTKIDARPFVFFGHSLGGLIAFELAYAIQEKIRRLPEKIFVSACCSPRDIRDEKKISHLPDDELIQRLKEYNGTPIEFFESSELLQFMLPIIRADFSLNENYQYIPRPSLTCPIIVYGGEQDTEVNPNGLNKWQLETSLPLKLRLFSGDHFFIDKNRKELLTQFKQDLFRSHDDNHK